MRFLYDEDIRYYIKLFIGGTLIFGVLAVIFFFVFQKKYDVVLKSNVFHYGDEISVSSIVESIGDIKIEKSMIVSSNTIQLDGYEVTFDDINTEILGKQTVNAYFSNNVESQSFEIEVIDTEKPIIKSLVEEPVEVELEDAKKKAFSSLYTVEDNQTPDSKINIRTYIEEESYDYGDEIHFVIKASDLSGNTSTKTLVLNIKKKKEPKKEENKNTSSSESGGGYSAPANNDSTYIPPEQDYSYTVPACSYASFYESSYGDLISAYNAAESYYSSCSGSAALMPINDADGNTIGWSVG